MGCRTATIRHWRVVREQAWRIDRWRCDHDTGGRLCNCRERCLQELRYFLQILCRGEYSLALRGGCRYEASCLCHGTHSRGGPPDGRTYRRCVAVASRAGLSVRRLQQERSLSDLAARHRECCGGRDQFCRRRSAGLAWLLEQRYEEDAGPALVPRAALDAR